MLAGLFADAGHHAGRRLIPPTASNPAGFHEDLDVNAANDDLLDAIADRPVDGTVSPPRSLRWLGAFEGRVDRAGGRELAPLVPEHPYVLKDPRFCYTLPAWFGTLGEPAVLVIVRHPEEVVASIASMRAREPETFAGFEPDPDHVRAMWVAMHRAVLGWCDAPGAPDVTFVSCDDVRDGTALTRLREATGVPLADSSIQPELHRERGDGPPADAAVSAVLADLLGRCRR